MARTVSINLVAENLNIIDRFIAWALTIGRLVVILTELIALTAFLYRFSLDRQLIDIHSKIKQEQAVLDYLKDYEQTFRDIQNRLSLTSTFGTQAEGKIKMLNDIVNFASPGITFNSIYLQEDRVRMNITLNSISGITKFIKQLKDYPAIGSVIVEKVEDRTSSASIKLSIIGTLKNYAKR